MNTSADAADLISSLSNCDAARVTLALSGGVDSVVLLALCVRAGLADRLQVVHVNHGLQPAASEWAKQCQALIADAGVSGAVETLLIAPGANLEARAREQRYQALMRHVPDQGVLLLAHHLNDQAETVLQRMMRGASVHGLGAMREWSERQGPNGMVRVWRPLLTTSRHQIESLAKQWQLSWVEDPSNEDLDFDRNFVRHQVMPILSERWDAANRLAHVAASCQAAADILEEVAQQDLQAALIAPNQLDISVLTALSVNRRHNLFAYWLRSMALPAAEKKVMQRIDQEVLAAGEDREPRLVWPGGVFARFQTSLYLLNPDQLEPLTGELNWQPTQTPVMRFGPWQLMARQGPSSQGPSTQGPSLPVKTTAEPITVKAAQGGELFFFKGMRRKVSELWRQQQIPPWQRRRLPLFFVGDELVAVAELGVADNWQAQADEDAIGIGYFLSD